MKNQIQHLFFDLDNTLWDHRGNSEITLKQMFSEFKIEEKYPIKFDKWHQVFYDKNELLWEHLREGKINKHQLREKRFRDPFLFFDIDNAELAVQFEDIYLEKMAKMTGTVDGALDLLKYLKPKYHIHVITNGFEEVSMAKITSSGMTDYVETLTGADELGVRKPDPRLFELAMQKAGAQKDNSLIIGDDWIADIIGGTSFGWKAIYFDVFGDQNQLDNVMVVNKLSEIKNYL